MAFTLDFLFSLVELINWLKRKNENENKKKIMRHTIILMRAQKQMDW